MVANFEAGGAAINQLCGQAGAELSVIPLDLNRPTHDLSQVPAMSSKECGMAFQAGADAVPADADILLLGEMGIGNTTAAAALALATFDGKAGDWAGPGTGLDKPGVNQKARLVEQAVSARHRPGQSAFEVMRQFGGRELAAIAGATLAARHRRIPVLLDGFVSTAAAAVLTIDNKRALDHCQISHLSTEPGHKQMAAKLGLSPILDLNMRLGEASGAALACLIVQAAAAVHNGMATFAEAGVTEIDP